MHIFHRIRAVLFLFLLSVGEQVMAQSSASSSGLPPDECDGVICLMEPLPGGMDKITPCGTPLGTFFLYFNKLWPWLIGSAAGLAVLMAIVGGLQVIMSGGDPGKRQEGTGRLQQALLGLLMLIFAGLILRILNPSFYKAGNVGAGCP